MILKIFMTALAMTILFMSTTFAAPIPLRGIVEGFYGKPWTFEDRADMMRFCRVHNLNAYIYAPKDDPYHRDKWRVPYPSAELNELKKLVDVAKENGVRFTFAISPGLDLNYEGKEGDRDFKLLIQKMESVYNLGVRSFAIFFDDLKDSNGKHHEDGAKQAQFLNKLQKEFYNRHKDINALITVPTEYFYEDMLNGKKATNYTEDFESTLDSTTIVLYTGDGVVCDGITDEQFSAASKLYERDLGIWWNYPVNDYNVTANGKRNAKLALGPVEKLPRSKVQAIYFNPMSQAQLSKIALATGADYANSPEIYDAQKSWDKALKELFGELAPAMKIFASHSQHMENNWAKVGPADGQNFTVAANLLFRQLRKKHTPDFTSLEKQIAEMQSAADTLLARLPQKYLKECKPQLEQFKRIAKADKVALDSLKAGKLDPSLKNLRAEISKYEPDAILSELAALKFIDDVLNFKF